MECHRSACIRYHTHQHTHTHTYTSYSPHTLYTSPYYIDPPLIDIIHTRTWRTIIAIQTRHTHPNTVVPWYTYVRFIQERHTFVRFTRWWKKRQKQRGKAFVVPVYSMVESSPPRSPTDPASSSSGDVAYSYTSSPPPPPLMLLPAGPPRLLMFRRAVVTRCGEDDEEAVEDVPVSNSRSGR